MAGGFPCSQGSLEWCLFNLASAPQRSRHNMVQHVTMTRPRGTPGRGARPLTLKGSAGRVGVRLAVEALAPAERGWAPVERALLTWPVKRATFRATRPEAPGRSVGHA